MASVNDSALFVLDGEGIVRGVSPAGKALTGLKVGDAFIGAFASMPTLASALATPHHVGRDGAQLHLDHMAIADGWVVAIQRDLARAVLRALFDWSIDQQCFIWSAGLERIFGISIHQFMSLLHPDDAPSMKYRLQERHGDGTMFAMHVRLHLAAGWQQVQISGTIRAGAPAILSGVIEPLVERPDRRALTGAERITTVGALCAGLAHELNNPLSWVTSNAAFVFEELHQLVGSSQAPMRLTECLAALRDIRAGADRIGSIIRDLRLFSHSDDATIGTVDLHRCIESALTMAGHELKPGIRVVRELSPVPPVSGNEGRISQLAFHLILNAAHALEGRPGTVTISTSIDPSGATVLSVIDDGRSLTPEQLPHLFEASFDSHGTQHLGMSRSIAQALVSELGGTLNVERGQTTTAFRARLPVATRTTPTPVPLRARVVVVDDEPGIITLMQRALGAEFEVHAFTTADAALAALTALAPDVILCDAGLPGISGLTLYDTLKSVAPLLAQRFILLTDSSHGDTPVDWVRANHVPLLEKPFGLDRLRQAVRDRLPKS